jgi:hypothetical protein
LDILPAKALGCTHSKKHLAILTAQSTWLYSQQKALGYTHGKKHLAILPEKNTYLYSQQKAVSYAQSKNTNVLIAEIYGPNYIFSMKVTNSNK